MVATKTGLHINPKHLYIGATPDGLITCECCGDGTLEIKCAVSLMQKNYKSWADVATLPPYLYRCGSKIQLKQSSGYYYQVLLQTNLELFKYNELNNILYVFSVWLQNLDKAFVLVDSLSNVMHSAEMV